MIRGRWLNNSNDAEEHQ
ncbi:Hypothetical protein PFCIRM119_04010 [Propionibacterium freudenreichii]|uniref:Uncharacterized protein n=2 Tax=Propionibacterium freudenreichii TaxID=1744 RepID=D7GEA6_PROFC|nr:Hypothetical protein PFREUD_13500 [Propionibacterium freudenreichii subsp. shermanii CIRM-BIA1]CDP48195.1 Hypothetical protein PFCIRM129_09950 [Propionibacterium freudenreichii subsp. freudenreichii]CEG86721.1 Hypothetical protein PFCIRM118_08010 [Propionibacterium freudenreichii]CEG87870.1 Hypothetical protein PFCIRM119_04010 [Propionibacterium freudenreichii]CEG89738.1 Hypothetical protein PFCIRM121_10730 [Propionibacterium freudenreichii]